MRLTAVIPTRNRPIDLGKAVASVLAQTRLPDTLMIVDQSPGDESRLAVEGLLAGGAALRLDYVHDTAITGLVDAKRVAAGRADGEVVCFLEDDIVLEEDYFEQIERGFAGRPEMLGCCGVVTNLPPLPAFYVGLFHLFHRGVFRDPRVGVHGFVAGRGHALISSHALSGGVSAWRREVFAEIRFDVENDFFMLEDIDFSTRAHARYGERFFINPNAQLAHHMSPVNRTRLGQRQQRKLREYVTFYKKRRGRTGAFVSLAWLVAGLFLEALFQAATARSLAPVAGALAGLSEGIRRPLKGEER